MTLMRRVAVRVCAVLVLTWTAGVPAGTSASVTAWTPQVFRAAADATSVHAAVRDRNRPVPGLTAADFELHDNGVPQQVEAVSIGSIPIDVTVILDSSGSVAGAPASQIRRDIAALMATLGSEDRLRVLSVSTVVTEITSLQPVSPAATIAPPPPAGATAWFHAVIAALLQPAAPGRPHLVVALGDAGDNVSLLDARDARAIAERADGVLQIVVRGESHGRGTGWLPFAGPGDLDRVRDIAEATGGQLTRVSADRPVAALLDRAVADFKTGYVLWFRPTGVTLGGWHDLRVRVRGHGYTVVARRGYVGG